MHPARPRAHARAADADKDRSASNACLVIRQCTCGTIVAWLHGCYKTLHHAPGHPYTAPRTQTRTGAHAPHVQPSTQEHAQACMPMH